ncbi:MAG: hypothetical protein ACRDZ3_06960 [Acidimicrobiia bacterium]
MITLRWLVVPAVWASSALSQVTMPATTMSPNSEATMARVSLASFSVPSIM